ncbi:hypothetical protein RMCBS344292_13860 [Rhizopus microsporus]|nr:hypothetical protein RMCBS344292_13860 [Rhizopus microsporus]
MKEPSPLRQVSGPGYSSDLGVLFEENEVQSNGLGYQSALNFIRPKPTFSTPFQNSVQSMEPPPSSASHSITRRPRAGTMPSFIQPPIANRPATNSSAALLLSTIEAGRHRSGSLNLPPVEPSFWGLGHDGPLSPSSEQLLQNDNDFSIARTMRSLGLEDDHEHEKEQEKENDDILTNSLFHHKSPPEFHLPSRSLLSGNNRNRSYSVNAAVRYDMEDSNVSPGGLPATFVKNTGLSFVSPLEGFNRQQNRPRAASMGRAEAGRLNNMMHPSVAFWNNNNSSNVQRASPLVAMTEEEIDEQPALSLGDSELLANILQSGSNNEMNQQMEILNGNTSITEKPYLTFSQSTPTFKENFQAQNVNQQHSRSLWVGNIDSSITIETLTQVFSMFGPIESVRLLLEKECAFINFFHVEDAVRAKEDVLTHMGGRIGNCIVRIGFGKADAAVTETNVSQPTRALWLGNIPGNTTPASLQSIFGTFGTIESVRVLSHKNCSFINFETVEDAVAARDALLQNKIFAPGFSTARVGFAKVPSTPTLSTRNSDSSASTPGNEKTEAFTSTPKSSSIEKNVNDKMTIEDWQKELYQIMKELGVGEKVTLSSISHLRTTSFYHDYIPSVPELGAGRKFDSSRLKEIRKRLDNAEDGAQEAEVIAFECMDEIAEITSDYIGNTLVQRLFEKCSEDTKTLMLERIGPHLAANSVHKNGTWATQKIIDLAKTPRQIELIRQHLQPYIPPLLLDQFGNYAVQCYLRLGQDADNSFIFDAMVEKLMSIAQGRFGARSMRGILESEYVTENQKILVAAALCQNATSLSTNANGALLISWLIESTHIANRMRVIAHQLTNNMAQLCTHKLGSQIVYKLINQSTDVESQDRIFKSLCVENILLEILSDQLRGLNFIQKVLACPSLSDEQKSVLRQHVCASLEQLKGPGHKKLLDQLLQENQ